MTNSIPILTVTGTKGKTTVVSLIASYLHELDRNVLHVDTTGHFVNGVRQSTAADSRDIWGIGTVTAAPGRYLYEFLSNKDLQQNGAAVLEASFSSARWGLGYSNHKLGIFLNVFEDHIDPRGTIKTKQDLAEAKSFVFSSIAKNGYAVFNADDEMVCHMLGKIPEDKNITLIPCGKEFEYFDLKKHVKDGGKYISLEDNRIMLKGNNTDLQLVNLKDMDWAFNGLYEPLSINIMFAAAGLYAFNDGLFTDEMSQILENISLNQQTGRMVAIKAKNGATVIADFAHEKHSLQAIAKLGRKLLPTDGKLRAVVRLSHERPDDVLIDTGKEIGRLFDDIAVYDKIDGHFRNPRPPFIKRYPQLIGKTSEIVAKAAKETNSDVARIIREDEAINYIANRTHANDVVIVIINDDTDRSLQFVNKAFETNIY